MFNHRKVEIEWGGRPFILETGKIARQADGAVFAQYGETVVLATVVSSKEVKQGFDFFPLTVNYQEKAFAAGKIPGGYFKREGRPTERETLISRLIDRPIRPLFVKGYKAETQIIVTVLQHDLENDPDVVSLIAASAALTLSGVPFMGPLAAARVGYIDGQYVLNPSVKKMPESKLDLIVAGTSEAVLMVESEAMELQEDVMLGAVIFGQECFRPVIDAIIKLAETSAREPRDFVQENSDSLQKAIFAIVKNDLEAAYDIENKPDRLQAIQEIKKTLDEKLADFFSAHGNEQEKQEYSSEKILDVFKEVQETVFRARILDRKVRVDGRTMSCIRPIVSEVAILSRTHGSALFTRGETQALVVATLGTTEDEQFIDSLLGTQKEAFMLHYNFPPYSVCEVGRVGSPARREIGHGKLAWKALRPMLPAYEKFPYTLRIVSEITESNGSSSMATVCGGSLALMDAGVPLIRPVAGIAMGLIKEDTRFMVLSDILGDEDFLGDMDFKVAGTSEGITALQMDIKIHGVTEEIMKIALGQAKEGRLHILNEMSKTISEGRTELGEFCPRIEMMRIPVDKIREVIGSGGKVIREIIEKTGAKINIEDDGSIKIASSSKEEIEAAKNWINTIALEPIVGEIYEGKVVKITDFGVFVNFFGPRDGLVHISQISTARVEKVTDVIKDGEKVWVKLIGFDDRGKVRLSMKSIDQATGKEIE